MLVRVLMSVVCSFALAAPAFAAVRVTARLPHVAVAGSAAAVRGQVHVRRRGLRVAVQQRTGGRWRVRGPSSRLRGSRFRLAWHAPRSAQVVRVRVVAIAGSAGRAVAASRSGRVAVTPTRVLSPARVMAAPAPGRVGVLRYAGRPSLPVGSFVAADAGPSTPDGLLARIVSSRVVGGSTLVAVRPATLLEAVPEGRISITPATSARAAAPARSFRSARAAAPARGFRSARAAAPARGFRSALSCTSGTKAELSGSLAVHLIPAFSMRWSLGGVDRAEAKATIRGDASLRAGISASGSCTLPETAVARWDAPPLRFFAGPIPVVVVPRTTLYLAGGASAQAALETAIHGHVSATAGLRYDGDVHPLGSFSHGFAYDPPTAHVTGSLNARLVPAVTLLLYGRAGPRFDLSAGLSLGADASADPWWTLTAPVELRAGLEVPGVDDLTIPQRTVFSRTFPIAQASAQGSSNPGPGPGSSPPPPPAPTPDAGTERARIEWNTGATDVDLHVWDAAGDHAWFRDPTAIPGAELAEDDRYGFGPEHFREHAQQGRALVYGLCYFDDGGGRPTTVSIHLTDPGGGTRELTRTLAREGDHVLLGSSPPGSAPVPPDGWCRP